MQQCCGSLEAIGRNTFFSIWFYSRTSSSLVPYWWVEHYHPKIIMTHLSFPGKCANWIKLSWIRQTTFWDSYKNWKKSYKASSGKFFCTANESSSGEVLDQQSVLLLWKYSEAFLPVNHCHYPSLMAINFGTNYYTRTDTLAISQLTNRPGVWVGNLIEHFTNMPLVNKLSGHMIHSASSLMFISNQCYLWV